jgi:hypothetical protein
MIEAFSEQLITIDELRARMPHLRCRETNLRGQLDALDAQVADRDAYLKLADDLEGFLAQLRGNAATADTGQRQRVLRLLVKDILIGPTRSPSGTASPPPQAAPAPASPRPTRRVTIAQVIYCVGGVSSPVLASTPWTWSLQLVRRCTSLRYRVSSRSSRTSCGAIHASGSRPIRSRSARSAESRSFLTRR